MLVVTTKWAIGDGSIHAGPASARVDEFFRAIRRAAWRGGFQRDGTYRPIDVLHLVFAGDTVDALCSRAWRGDARPWRTGRRSAHAADRVADGAVRVGRRVGARIARLLRDGITVPAADGRRRPVLGRFVRARADVCFLWGDLDRPLERTAAALAIAAAGVSIGRECRAEDGPHASPGDRPPSLRESVNVELLVDFATHVLDLPGVGERAAPWLRRLAVATLADLPRHVDAWAATSGTAALRDAWRLAVRRWHGRACIDVPEAAVPFAVADPVAAWFDRGVDDPAAMPPPELGVLGPEWSSRPVRGDVSSLPLAVVDDGHAAAAEVAMALAIMEAAPDRGPIVARLGASTEPLGIIDAA
jgi:hypothetical protein